MIDMGNNWKYKTMCIWSFGLSDFQLHRGRQKQRYMFSIAGDCTLRREGHWVQRSQKTTICQIVTQSSAETQPGPQGARPDWGLELPCRRYVFSNSLKNISSSWALSSLQPPDWSFREVTKKDARSPKWEQLVPTGILPNPAYQWKRQSDRKEEGARISHCSSSSPF